MPGTLSAKCTSTTGPITCDTFPIFPPEADMYLSILLNFLSYLFQRNSTRCYLRQLGCDLTLAHLVVSQGQIKNQIARGLSRVFHHNHAGRMFRGIGFQNGLVNLRLDDSRQEMIDDSIGGGLEEIVIN